MGGRASEIGSVEPSCPRLSLASTSRRGCASKDVDGRDTSGTKCPGAAITQRERQARAAPLNETQKKPPWACPGRRVCKRSCFVLYRSGLVKLNLAHVLGDEEREALLQPRPSLGRFVGTLMCPRRWERRNREPLMRLRKSSQRCTDGVLVTMDIASIVSAAFKHARIRGGHVFYSIRNAIATLWVRPAPLVHARSS